MNTNLQKAKKIVALEKFHLKERTELLHFIRYMFKHAIKREFQDSWHYDEIATTLEEIERGGSKRIIINVPPRSGKTMMTTIMYAIWRLGREPSTKIAVVGYSQALTEKFSQEAKDLYKSEAFARVFPRRSKCRDDQDTKTYWKLDAGGCYLATSVDGRITGIGFDLILMDDMLKPADADSDTRRIGVNNWYLNTIPSRLDNPDTGALINIAQRTHEEDLPGMLMDRDTEKQWKVLSYPAIAEVDETYRKEGEPLMDNDHFNLAKYEQIRKDTSPLVWSTQYQQAPVSDLNRVFHKEWFRYFDHAKDGQIYIAVDPASAGNALADTDYTSIAVGRFVADSLYIEDMSFGRFKEHELIEEIVYMIKKWNPISCGIEKNGFQKFLKMPLQNALDRDGTYCRLEDISQGTARKDSKDKIRKLEPLYRNGQIYHKREAAYIPELEKQLLSFPRGSHDDCPDSIQMLFELSPLIADRTSTMANTYFGEEYETEYDKFGRPV